MSEVETDSQPADKCESWRQEDHGNGSLIGADALLFDARHAHRVAVSVDVVICKISHMDHPLLADHAGRCMVALEWIHADAWLICRERITPVCRNAQAAQCVVDHLKMCHGRIAEPGRSLQDRVEYRVLVIAGLADDLQDFPRRRLALQPDLKFLELADVLDGDHSLRGEGLDQRGFVCREGRYFLLPDNEAADSARG